MVPGQESAFGTLTFTNGNKTFIGTVNIGSPVGNEPEVAVAGTYSLDATGRGILAFTSGLHTGNSVFYLVEHSNLVLLNSITTGDSFPILLRGTCVHFVQGFLGGVVCQ